VAETVPLAESGALIPAAALAALAGLLPGPLRAVRMPGGRGVNLCLRIDAGSGRSLVLRLRRGPRLAGADPHRELEAQRLAAAAGLAPAILEADLEHGWSVMEHVDAAPWSAARLHDRASLWRLGERLRRLHALPPPSCPPFDALALLQTSCDVLVAHGGQGARELMQRGSELTAQLALLPSRPAVLCHGDPDAQNFLGHEPVMVDFEYAQVADPTYDAALLLAYYPFLEPQTDMLLAAMGVDDPLSLRRLPLELERYRVIDEAWVRAGAILSALD
jgi:aminoglycoside phosphotransferase (APT) family kinase protein